MFYDYLGSLARFARATRACVSGAPCNGLVLSPTWGPDVSGKGLKALPRTTYHPDPRRLAENRAVVLKAMPPNKGTESARSAWNKVWDGMTALVR